MPLRCEDRFDTILHETDGYFVCPSVTHHPEYEAPMRMYAVVRLEDYVVQSRHAEYSRAILTCEQFERELLQAADLRAARKPSLQRESPF
jgi:hypothetical protein